MSDTEKITQPSLGSNELGRETNDTHLTSGISTGTDTQLHLAALSVKHKKNADDEKVVSNPTSEKDSLKEGETGE